jgi:hypothetical protein
MDIINEENVMDNLESVKHKWNLGWLKQHSGIKVDVR